ncbi:hypothetical protein MKEN_01053600 [Mycena kentingensis (nom. inval.)]|nr:hypothetical protein MKEN_01053600 [Mycena kentingensis (nom. inval.)]
MSHPLLFPGKYFFYALGNTMAVPLLRDISPDEAANVLLLGCGDPRNVLYTIYCEGENATRDMDFTCCDFDAGVIARNVLLLTLIGDDQWKSSAIWNIFFHYMVNTDDLQSLINQCNKLLLIGDSIEDWESSGYAPYIRMGSQNTYSEIRRHWILYVEMKKLPIERKRAILAAFRKEIGYAGASGSLICKEIVATYYKTGTTFLSSKDAAAATTLNPTFVYSLGGEGCSVHYTTDPLAGFHFASLFGNSTTTVSATELLAAAKRHKAKPPVVRFFATDALGLCKALDAFRVCGAVDLGIPVAQWKTQTIKLNHNEYGPDGLAPCTFNVIDTSNLTDHSGLLNVMIAAVPLLRKPNYGGGVLYTESLIYMGTDGTKEFATRLYGDLQTVGFLLGLVPTDYASGFASRSNTHELNIHKTETGSELGQFHQMTTWKAPSTADPLVASSSTSPGPASWNSQQLGKLLYSIYYNLFEQEDAMHFWRINMNNKKAFRGSNIVHYMRESFVLFLKLVRENFELGPSFLDVMKKFIALKEADKSLPMDSVNYQELAGQLHLHRIYTVPWLHIRPKEGRFSEWDTVPVLTRVILVVPRDRLQVLERLSQQVGSPVLQCDTRGLRTHNIFTAIHIAFGTVIPRGTKRQPRVIFKEDPEGWKGTSPLVVSFVVSAGILTIEPLKDMRVCLSIRTTPVAVMHVVKELGMEQSLFSADLQDEEHVHVLPQEPYPTPSNATQRPEPPTGSAPQIGTADPVAVELDGTCELISSFSAMVHVEDGQAKALLGSGASPEVAQISPCVMRLTLGERVQNILFPIPIAGSDHRLRVARKSLYIDIIVPPALPFQKDGMKLLPYPVVGPSGSLHAWNLHRVSIPRSPSVKVKKNNQKKWLSAHLKSMLSTRELALRKSNEDDSLMRMKDMLSTLLLEVGTGVVQKVIRIQAPVDNSVDAESVCDTILFVNDLKFDLGSHTVFCDAYALSITNALLSEIGADLPPLEDAPSTYTLSISKEVLGTWKQLLPALSERCRSWKHLETCEYAIEQRVPLSLDLRHDLLCSCGKGQDVAPMKKIARWAPFAPFVVRVAISPLFAVSYLERVGRDPDAGRCAVCHGKGKPKMQTCSGCGKVRYCSKECQKSDWKEHKSRCKQSVVKVGS